MRRAQHPPHFSGITHISARDMANFTYITVEKAFFRLHSKTSIDLFITFFVKDLGQNLMLLLKPNAVSGLQDLKVVIGAKIHANKCRLVPYESTFLRCDSIVLNE